MNPHLAPLDVPDGSALSAVQRLGDLTEPYLGPAATDALFTEALNEANAWHAERSPFFGRLWRSRPRTPLTTAADAAELPYLHANFLKQHEVLSIPREDVVLHLTSSGTTGQRSQMFFDTWSIRAGQRMVARIFDHYGWITPGQPVNYLVFGYEPAPGASRGTAFTTHYFCDFAPAKSVFHALRHNGTDHAFDPFGCVDTLVRYAEEGLPVRMFGFPSFLYFTLKQLRARGVPPLRLPADSLVLLGGGWKGHADQQIGKEELHALVEERLGIPADRVRDGYGSVEHSVPYTECARHRFHVPVWSRLFVRDVRTRQVLPYGERGYPHFLAPHMTSAPVHSVLMGDLVSQYPGSECGCGIDTPYFTIHGRAGTGKNRSCAVAAAELMKGAAA